MRRTYIAGTLVLVTVEAEDQEAVNTAFKNLVGEQIVWAGLPGSGHDKVTKFSVSITGFYDLPENPHAAVKDTE